MSKKIIGIIILGMSIITIGTGIFLYFSEDKDNKKVKGNVRLLFELNYNDDNKMNFEHSDGLYLSIFDLTGEYELYDENKNLIDSAKDDYVIELLYGGYYYYYNYENYEKIELRRNGNIITTINSYEDVEFKMINDPNDEKSKYIPNVIIYGINSEIVVACDYDRYCYIINRDTGKFIELTYDVQIESDKNKYLYSSLWLDLERKYGIVNFNGEEIIPMKYDEINSFDNPLYFAVLLDDLYGVIDKSNKTVLPFNYDDIYITEKYFLTLKDNVLEIFDINFKSIGKKSYDLPLEDELLYFTRDLKVIDNGDNIAVLDDYSFNFSYEDDPSDSLVVTKNKELISKNYIYIEGSEFLNGTPIFYERYFSDEINKVIFYDNNFEIIKEFIIDAKFDNKEDEVFVSFFNDTEIGIAIDYVDDNGIDKVVNVDFVLALIDFKSFEVTKMVNSNMNVYNGYLDYNDYNDFVVTSDYSAFSDKVSIYDYEGNFIKTFKGEFVPATEWKSNYFTICDDKKCSLYEYVK